MCRLVLVAGGLIRSSKRPARSNRQRRYPRAHTHHHHHHYPRCSLPLSHIWPCSEQHTAHKTTHHAVWSGHVTRMTCNTDWKVCCGIRHSVLYHRFTYAAWKAIHALGRPSAWPMSEALIESRQFIGWWRDAAPDALTSSAYTGEHAIYSSDFSAEKNSVGSMRSLASNAASRSLLRKQGLCE